MASKQRGSWNDPASQLAAQLRQFSDSCDGSEYQQDQYSEIYDDYGSEQDQFDRPRPRTFANLLRAFGVPFPDMDEARWAYHVAYEDARNRHAFFSATITKLLPTETVKVNVDSWADQVVEEVSADLYHTFMRILIRIVIITTGYVLVPSFIIHQLLQWIFKNTNWRDYFGEELLDYLALGPDPTLNEIYWKLVGWLLRCIIRIPGWICSGIWHICNFLCTNSVTTMIVNGVTSSARDTADWFDQTMIDLRQHPQVERAMFQYRGLCIWFRRHTWHIVILIWSLVVFAMMIRFVNFEPTNRFMSWHEFQRYWPEPLPDILLQTPKASGSNSHYWRPTQEKFDVPVVGTSRPALTMSSQEETQCFATAPKVITVIKEGNAYCLDCRQWHCCELPY